MKHVCRKIIHDTNTISRLSQSVEAARHFVTESAPFITQQTSINGSIGGDYKLSRNLDLNTEFRAGLFTFSSTDERIRIREFLLLFGVGYIF